MSLQPPREDDEALNRVLAILQLLHVGDEAIGLDRIAESGRRLVVPSVEGFRLRHAIEAGIDLDSIELLRVALEPALLRQALWIEDAPPVLVHPARATDVNPL